MCRRERFHPPWPGRAGLALAIGLSIASRVRAEEDLTAREKAKAKVTEGAKLFEAGDPSGALSRFEEAYALFPSPKIFYNKGLAYEKLGQHGQAFMAFERFLRETPDATPQYVTHSRQELERLSKHVAFVNLSCDVVDADVMLDGRRVGKTPLKSRLPVDTGPHDLLVRSTELGSKSEQFTAVGGQVMELKVDLRPARTTPPAPPLAPVALSQPRAIEGSATAEPIVPQTPDRPDTEAPSSPADGHGALRTAGWILAGGAVVAGGLAIFETATWLDKRNQFDDHMGPRPAMGGVPATMGIDCAKNLPDRGFSPDCRQIYDSMSSARTLAIIGYVATGLLTAGSIVFFSLGGSHAESGTGISLRCGPMLGAGAVCAAAF